MIIKTKVTIILSEIREWTFLWFVCVLLLDKSDTIMVESKN